MTRIHTLAVLAAVVLTLGVSKPLPAQTEASDEKAELVIMSEPAGATVYVDGDDQGATPLQLSNLIPGEHRVRLVKPGFLENRRTVVLEAGKVREVRVQLIALADTSAPVESAQKPAESKPSAGQVQPTVAKKKDSSKKLLYIAAGAAAVGGGVFALMPKNAAPVAGSATATPSTALMAVTEVSFASVDASDKDGDTLTYSWDFGDSTTGSGPNVKHTYAAAGTYAATVTVSDGKKSATTTAPAVNVVSLNGNWSGTFGTSGVNRFAFTLTQTGTQLTGGFDMIWANTYCQTNGERLVSASVRTPQRMSLTVEVPTSCYGTYLGALTDHYECDLDSTFQVCTGVWTEDGFSTSYQFTMRK